MLVGATAMQLWGTTRATRDIDILIEPTEENATRVLNALSHLQIPTASIDDLIASKQTGRLQDAADIEVLEQIKRLRQG